jgi:hypothetical protein
MRFSSEELSVRIKECEMLVFLSFWFEGQKVELIVSLTVPFAPGSVNGIHIKCSVIKKKTVSANLCFG